MTFRSIPLGFALAATLCLASSHASAASDLQALSETEMSSVYGRGLSEPTLAALTAQEQGGSAVSAASANTALMSLAALSADDMQAIDRQMAQQRAQGATTAIQANLKIAQTMAALNGALAPLAGGLSLPMLPFPLLFAMPSLDAVQKKH